MKREITSKATFLFLVTTTVLFVFAGLDISVGVTHSKSVSNSVSLCNSSKDVTTLTVHRGTTLNPTTFSFPSIVFVGNTGSARSVVTAICATRPFAGKGIFACPFDQALTYDLVFTLPKYKISPINLGGSGFCSWLKGTGKFGWIRPTSNFFQVLGSAMHLHLATSETFAGKMK